MLMSTDAVITFSFGLFLRLAAISLTKFFNLIYIKHFTDLFLRLYACSISFTFLLPYIAIVVRC